jgi:hypothetical protein
MQTVLANPTYVTTPDHTRTIPYVTTPDHTRTISYVTTPDHTRTIPLYHDKSVFAVAIKPLRWKRLYLARTQHLLHYQHQCFAHTNFTP